MKTAKEIHNGNKNRLNLPLHKLFGWFGSFFQASVGVCTVAVFWRGLSVCGS